jgi:hypothetical protein
MVSSPKRARCCGSARGFARAARSPPPCLALPAVRRREAQARDPSGKGYGAGGSGAKIPAARR